MNSQDAMKLLVTEDLQPLLASRGFRKRALTFFQRVDRNFVLLQLQKTSPPLRSR